MLLPGKNAVITGCLQGIGRATLEAFAREGANVYACCQNEDADFDKYTIDLSEKYGVSIIPVYFDFLDETAIKHGVSVILKDKKNIDVLVNVAGVTLDALFHMVTMEQMKKTFSINFFSQMFFTQYITKMMLRQKKGSVINVASISALDGNPGQLSYAASKAALIAATKTLSAELAPKGIRVNAVAPGVIQTAMTANLPQEVLRRQMARCELKRLGLPEEVANAILYLASDASSYITGQVVRIDGGIG
ncbi:MULTISPECIES: SDR family NAD(P)-dependent oxidoreductase [unclassified Symbiopectobacterium]|uniref:SDR family NAD(P)-dependent oxidoreductase n=2 Tax=Symbiopectobacterium TaxID=801 RepID=UPI002226A1A6|nr:MULTISPECIES: SDR family oxidoreductase [unclassified Symbiopectobacterium]MCW2474357.1 SDR family oxidoreductase [Candidatus Symbiopectobacterium sp. NZEC151]MCW2485598.1 SDR family oxidoreductase [Candidatus Symbiopectobacterium sp. NZEC127]